MFVFENILKDDQLKYILQHIDLAECEELIENYIYYSIQNIPRKERA